MAPTAVEVLRKQLREKFPQAHGVRTDPAPILPSGKPFVVSTFPVGAISEVVPDRPASGILLLVAGLLGEPADAGPHPEMVLVDGADAFDPGSFTGSACSKLLWVRCSSALEMVKAADLLVHDGNVLFVLLDATGLARRDLASLPPSAWWRMKQAAEKNGARMVVLAPFPLIPCASLRLTLSADLSLRDLDSPRTELLERLQPVAGELRRAT